MQLTGCMSDYMQPFGCMSTFRPAGIECLEADDTIAADDEVC
jgi:hypothetical protein